MSFTYTRSLFKSRVNAGIHNRIGMLIDVNETLNQAVRKAYAKIDFRSARRESVLSPNLYNGIFDYNCPADLMANKIIDIPAQAKRYDGDFFMIPPRDFDVAQPKGALALDTFNGTRVIKINSSVDSKSIVISELDSLTSSGSWSAFGDATNLSADDSDFIKGNGSIKFDLSDAGGTTAGIESSTVSLFDISDYRGGTSAFFVWAKINSPTNLTNYIIRFGSDSSNYYSKTVTAQADGTSFVAGWNLLRFDISSLTTVGTPNQGAITYISLYMTKTSGKISETDYKFDYLVLKKGVIHNLKYYTKYAWQSEAGVYKENSTDDLDLLVAESDEFELLVEIATAVAAKEVREYDIAKEITAESNINIKQYQMNNPSEAKIMTTEYYSYDYNHNDYGSVY